MNVAKESSGILLKNNRSMVTWTHGIHTKKLHNAARDTASCQVEFPNGAPFHGIDGK